MIKLIPTFSYKYSLEVEDVTKSLSVLKSRFTDKGGLVMAESEHDFVIEIPSGNLALAVNMVPSKLRIHIQIDNGSRGIQVEVFRFGERRFAIVFVLLASVISAAAYLQNREPKALLMPFLFYIFLWLYSFLPAHPAHKAIRNLTKFSDES
jgi:hypothetical protein